jgi:truncated hemoglobin YjbI
MYPTSMEFTYQELGTKEQMNSLEQNTNLAYQIGLRRIALVVDQIHHQMRSQHTLAELFRLGAHRDQRARLSYFWWVVLGGNELRCSDLNLLPSELRSLITPELFREWLGLFRHTARPIIGEDLTRAWAEKAEEVANLLVPSSCSQQKLCASHLVHCLNTAEES